MILSYEVGIDSGLNVNQDNPIISYQMVGLALTRVSLAATIRLKRSELYWKTIFFRFNSSFLALVTIVMKCVESSFRFIVNNNNVDVFKLISHLF